LKIRRRCACCSKKRYIDKLVVVVFPIIRKGKSWVCREHISDKSIDKFVVMSPQGDIMERG